MKLLPTLSLTALLGLSTLGSYAADTSNDEQQRRGGREQRHTVWIIGGNSQDSSELVILKGRAVDLYKNTLESGFQQSGTPHFIISDKKNKAIFGIGGFASLRTLYDWNGVVDNKDFVTYDIPMYATPGNRQRFLMDPTTSRLFFRSVVNAGSFGPIVTYLETDFRGQGNSLRLREAYVSFKGFLFGQAATTFVDLAASPNTIDFEGPNAYTYNRNVMIRYRHSFNSHWTVALAAEMPDLSATPGALTTMIPQRVPDVPFYVQYSWNKSKSHVRASGLFRTLYYHNDETDNTVPVFGWGAQLSSVIAIGSHVNLMGQVVYGEGISNYIQDLNGNGLDLVANPMAPGRLQTLQTMGWLAGVQVNFARQWQTNIGYSQVNIWNKNDYYTQNPDAYRMSQYMVANLFYNITPALQVGVEYLHGTRRNADNAFGAANRAQMMVQYNF